MLSRLFMAPRICLMLMVIVCSSCGQVEFTFVDGQQKPLNSLAGSWVVVNYWATWCKPCVEEIPELNRLNEHDDVFVFGVNYDGLIGAALSSEAKALGINYGLILVDPSEKIDIKRPAALPATVLIDRDGNTRTVLYGPQTMNSIVRKIQLLERE